MTCFLKFGFAFLMEQLAIPLSNQNTVAKWLVIRDLRVSA
jgi:hypothetical protein